LFTTSTWLRSKTTERDRILKIKEKKGKEKKWFKKITYQADWSSTFPVTFRGELALVGGDGCLPGISA
jgi:hypothetical protein